MEHTHNQKALSAKLSGMPKEIADKAVQALGGFASGFLSGWEAAKNESRREAEKGGETDGEKARVAE